MGISDTQIGFATESTAGTAVTVTDFVRLRSENIRNDIARIEDDSIEAGRRFIDSSQWTPGAATVSGSVQSYLYDVGMLELFRTMFGTLATTGPVGSDYTHTFTPGSVADDTLTIQVGRPFVDSATVQAYTYAGCLMSGWSLSAVANQPVTFAMDVLGQSEVTNVALATASYPTATRFEYYNACVNVASSAVKAKSLDITCDMGLTRDRFYLCQQNPEIAEEVNLRTVTGTLVLDHLSLTEYNRFIGGDEFEIEFVCTAGTNTITITMNCRYDGETPNVPGRELLEQRLPFKAIGATTDASAITAVIFNTEATA
jgi:hypothetical protein